MFALGSLNCSMADLTREQFDELLAWLDGDVERAARKYEQIQQRLVRLFASRGCVDAEALADETIDRVAGKVSWLKENYTGDPIFYFYGVAQKVYREWERKLRRKSELPTPKDVMELEEREREAQCLDDCSEQAPVESVGLVLRYYEGEKRVKIMNRQNLAKELGITLDALRIRAHRIRRDLRKCVIDCLERTREH